MTQQRQTKGQLDRRDTLKLGLALAAGAALAGCGRQLRGAGEAVPLRSLAGLPEVAPIEPGTVSRTQFAPKEQRVARHLATLAALANSVEDADPATYGFITGEWWRTPDNKPYNARVQENALTLAYFFSQARPWNPYTGDDALRQRLEAALSYWLKLQFDDGSFPEYRPTEHSRPATAFAMSFFGEALRVLAEGPGIDPALRARVEEALNAAAAWFLNPRNGQVWGEQGYIFSNQIAAGLAGYSVVQPFIKDRALDERFRERTEVFAENAQSSAGYFYELGEVDQGYSYGVMTRDMAQLYERFKSPTLLRMQERYYDWLSYTHVLEPDGTGFWKGSAISSRSDSITLDAYQDDSETSDSNHLWAQYIPQAAAYVSSAEERAAAREVWRQGSWAEVEPLGRNQVSPAVIVNALLPEAFPSSEEKRAAIATLPYLRQDAFTEYRADTRRPQQHLFVRRPAYYAGLAFGRKYNASRSRKRMGLSFLWHPQMGMLIYSLNNTNTLVWSTVAEDRVDAASDLAASYFRGVSDQAADPDQLGAEDTFTVRYGPSGGWVDKRVFFNGSGLDVSVNAAGALREQLPLVVLPTDSLTWLGSAAALSYGETGRATTATGFALQRGAHTLEISWRKPLPVALNATERRFFADARRQVHLLSVEAEKTLSYRVRLR